MLTYTRPLNKSPEFVLCSCGETSLGYGTYPVVMVPRTLQEAKALSPKP